MPEVVHDEMDPLPPMGESPAVEPLPPVDLPASISPEGVSDAAAGGVDVTPLAHTPSLEDPHVMITLAILVGVTLFYARGRVSIAMVSFGLLVSLVATFHFFPLIDPVTGLNKVEIPRLFAGFSNPALITVVALLVVGEGISRTGALAIIAKLIHRVSEGNWRLALGLSLVVVAVASAFLNNAPIVVIFLPILQAVARDMEISPSKLLMPLSFASILGGSCTLIGSSTNILIADFAQQTGVAKLEMFTFTALGAMVMVVGLVYLITLAPSMLPERDEEGGSDKDGRHIMAQLQITPNSTLVGRRPLDADDDLFKRVKFFRAFRGSRVFSGKFRNVELKPHDIITLEGTIEDLKKIEWTTQSTLTPELLEVDPEKQGRGSRQLEPLPDDGERSDEPPPLDPSESTLAEVVITPNSPLVGRTLSGIRFRARYGPVVIGFQRAHHRLKRRITEIPLRGGDMLVIQGRPQDIKKLRGLPEFFLFWGAQEQVINLPKARVAIAILFGIVALALTPYANMLILSLLGAFGIMATGCLTLEQGYRSVPPELLVLIGATLALGDVMQATGTAEVLAHGVIQSTAGWSPWAVMAIFGLMVTIFTNVISNNATVILFAPIAVGVAGMLEVNALPFLMATLFGANAAFSSPIGYKTNLLVLKAGNYRFADFFRMGLPLNIMAWLFVSAMIPWFWPF